LGLKTTRTEHPKGVRSLETLYKIDIMGATDRPKAVWDAHLLGQAPQPD
jgi:hypothetical protein